MENYQLYLGDLRSNFDNILYILTAFWDFHNKILCYYLQFIYPLASEVHIINCRVVSLEMITSSKRVHTSTTL